ncbi:hypothetical protein F2Q69_00012577 [Brassica cretica]|uniref:Uncharacterized protein n=1 Tax=Brassica cretica TaxID=69181 RepID=A0A8S9QQF1_BRACR|nr:hypothetical protein F2Q69_00012577 [Brassica cretica]
MKTRRECVIFASCIHARHMASGTGRSSFPYGERDDAVLARRMASRLRSSPSFGYLLVIRMVGE